LRDSSGALTAVRKCAEIILTSFVRTSDIDQGENSDFMRNAYAFMTFGQGTRKFPSEHYARSVMKCMLMTLMTGSRFQLPESMLDWFQRRGPDTIEIEILMKA
jgi:cytochrome P450